MFVAALIYFAVLILLTAGMIVTEARSPSGAPKVRTIIAVAGNCLLANGYTALTRDTDPWAYFMALDLITATVILYQPAGRPQAIIGTLYLVQIAMHTAYGIAGLKGDPIVYWWMLTVTGFLQLLFCGGWWIRDRWGRHFLRLPRDREVVVTPYRTGLD